MSKLDMYCQHLANTNGTVDPNVSTWLLTSSLEATIVLFEIAWELIELWLIFANLENLEIHQELPNTLPRQY
jgi:hypothetical protein